MCPRLCLSLSLVCWVRKGLGIKGREERRLRVGAVEEGGWELSEGEGLAGSGAKTWKVEADRMAGTIFLLVVGKGIPLLDKTYLMISRDVLGSLENKTL